MKRKASALDNMAIYPLLIGIYPVLALYYFNVGEIETVAIFKAVITSLVITAVTSLFFLVTFRSWNKAAIYAGFSLFFFLTYGHMFNLFNHLSISGTLVGRHRYLLTTWAIIYLTGLYLLSKLKNANTVTRTLNTVSLLLVAFIVAQIGFFLLQAKIVQDKNQSSQEVVQNIHSDTFNRDVYYILVDAYSREDLLREKLGLDTSGFINDLKNLGFYVPNCAQSNYNFTSGSLASSLNMNYLDTFGIKVDLKDKTSFGPLIHNSIVRRSLVGLGYQTVTFKNLHPPTDINDSTYYFDFFKDTSALSQSNSINFQYLFLNTTAFLPVREYLETRDNVILPAFLDTWIPIGNSLNSREYRQYQQNLFALQKLEELPGLSGSKFVYAHLYTTHQPYVFYPDGRFHPNLVQGPTAYRDQVIFANQRLIEVLKTILEKSEEEPIIILQSDHSYFEGPDRVKILSAYHLPGDAEKYLYDTITPVNSFRIIFNVFFNGNYQMLPDISRYFDEDNNLVTAPPTCAN